jgi:hypothetical protein
VKKLLTTVLAVLKEIGDENAYRRFLALHGLRPSRQSWREFSEQRHQARYRKPKCC